MGYVLLGSLAFLVALIVIVIETAIKLYRILRSQTKIPWPSIDVRRSASR